MASTTPQTSQASGNLSARDTAGEAHNNSLIELAKGFPDETVRYLQISLLIGGVCSILVTLPSSALLFFDWERCALCERPLRLWLTIAALLHFVQAPLRFACHNWLLVGARKAAAAAVLRRAEMPQSEAELHHRQQICCLINSIVKARSWRVSQAASVVSLAWFLVGAVWVGSTSPGDQGCPEAWYLTALVILLAATRILASIVSFRLTFCTSSAEASLLSQMERAAGSQAPCGVTPSRLEQFTSLVCGEAHATANSGSQCSVCLSCFHLGEGLRVLPCGHYFHQKCVDEWLLKRCVCPLCRSDEAAWADAGKAKVP